MPKFAVTYRVHGTAHHVIEAASKEDLEEKLAAEAESDDFEIDIDDFDDVDFTISEMHPVTRDGREIWTTYVMKTDVRSHASAVESTPLFGSD